MKSNSKHTEQQKEVSIFLRTFSAGLRN